MKNKEAYGIIGTGPSAIFLLKHLMDCVDRGELELGSISVFERSQIAGTGMPYSPEMTDVFSMSNISSEELPPLIQPFAEWLSDQPKETLRNLGVEGPITEEQIYPRVALGRYLQSQYHLILDSLRDQNVEIHEFTGCEVCDIEETPVDGGLRVVTREGARHQFDRVVISTGHCWPAEDEPDRGCFRSPWPIFKLMPSRGAYYNFPVGILGSSLSAFDVINSLARRHGKFVSSKDGAMTYQLDPEAKGFKLLMHSAEGLLPHLQFAQEKPMREIYRHVGREELLKLVDARGFLRLERYFDKICRPVLISAFEKDGLPDLADHLRNRSFHLRDFVELMTDTHTYADAFAGMRNEMGEARDSVVHDRPIHWKEYMDDLMYTLNFHAELMPAEDHLALKTLVMPFLMNVIAAMPLPSGEILLALHDAGILEMITGRVEILGEQPRGQSTRVVISNGRQKTTTDYRMFIDCGGQKPLEISDYPFDSLIKSGLIRRATVEFVDPSNAERTVPKDNYDKLTTDDRGQTCYFVGGIEVDRFYRIVGANGQPNPRLFEISFPLIMGLRPYSYGLQACDETARLMVAGLDVTSKAMPEYEDG